MSVSIVWNEANSVGVACRDAQLAYELRKGALNPLGIVSGAFVEAWADMTAEDNCTIREFLPHEMGNRGTLDELKYQMTLPVEREYPDMRLPSECDPWAAFPAFYGSYSSDFDDMAILVLENIRDGKWGADNGEGLAHEMFREVLCTSGLCNYGTSPRGCFPEPEFAEVLPALIEKWRAYRDAQWQDDGR